MGNVTDLSAQFANRRAEAAEQRLRGKAPHYPETTIARAIQDNKDELNRAGVFNRQGGRPPKVSPDMGRLMYRDTNGRYRIDLPVFEGLFENLDAIAQLSNIQGKPIIAKIPVMVDESTRLAPFEIIISSGHLDRSRKLEILQNFRTYEEQQFKKFLSTPEGQGWFEQNTQPATVHPLLDDHRPG